ncbi:MAG: divalent-cation tolerance protein CutA [Hyphomicrobiaceae bacterium]
MSKNEQVLIYTTWPDTDSAEAAGRALVGGRQAACVNVLGVATAIYAWQGAIERDSEYPMLIKTVGAQVAGVIETVRRLHPYDVPAVAVVPIAGGDPEFLAWIEAQTHQNETIEETGALGAEHNSKDNGNDAE